MADIQGRDTELVLPPGTYAFVLDETKGNINVYCGPIKQSLSNTDRLVVLDSGTKQFVRVDHQSRAIQNNIIAPKGCYVVLENPATNGRQPESGKAEIMPIGTLSYGRIENQPGPWSHPLWPGQVATVVKGHHLRSNQYLLVRVYDDEAAKANWDKSVVKGVVSEPNPTSTSGEQPKVEQKPSKPSSNVLGIDKDTLVTGQLIVIKGTDVAFYIPPTGVEVLVDERGKYVRDAVTLERLEYSILLDESGNKEYRKGPDVVFPTPTQTFFEKAGTTPDGERTTMRKFRAFELQPTNGIHIKVIADYEEDSKAHKAGDELFITGDECSIYYPREEHAIISYGGNEKSYAVAIPPGEGRYVLNRQSGEVELVTGPLMFLPDPRKEVIVRRILSAAECSMYYPGNREVLEFNTSLNENGIDAVSDPMVLNTMMARSYTPARNEKARAAFADTLTRSTAYTPPRMITLNTKFDGAVRIDVWTGYAVQVVSSKGERRTIIGPQTVLLRYDEYLERLSLSKGKPKSNDNRIDTAYLLYLSNPVSDIISLKTQDLVNVDIQVKYLVRFEQNQSDKWFNVGNYVQYMVDHLRSLIGNAVRNIGVQDFYSNAATILRDVVLGQKDAESGERPLKHFNENGMTVYDLELIAVAVQDRPVAEMLARSRHETLSDSIALERAQAKSKLTAGIQEAERVEETEKAKTVELRDRLTRETASRRAKHELESTLESIRLKVEKEKGEEAAAKIRQAAEAILLEIDRAQRELEEAFAESESSRHIRERHEEANAHKIKMEAITPTLVEALVATAQSALFDNMAENIAPLSLVRGESLSTTLQTVLAGTPFEHILGNLQRLSGGVRGIANGKTETVEG